MKTKSLFILLFVVSFLVSCSSRYKASQTPDDMYYSPTENEYYVANKVENPNDDEFLKRKVANRNRWNSLDDFIYWHDARYEHLRYMNDMDVELTWSITRHDAYCNSALQLWYFLDGKWNKGFYNGKLHFMSYYYPKVVQQFSKTNILAYSKPNINNNNFYYNYKSGIKQGEDISGDRSVRTVSYGNADNGVGNVINPSRTFDNSNGTTSPSSDAGGNSGGFNSRGSNTNKPRG